MSAEDKHFTLSDGTVITLKPLRLREFMAVKTVLTRLFLRAKRDQEFGWSDVTALPPSELLIRILGVANLEDVTQLLTTLTNIEAGQVETLAIRDVMSLISEFLNTELRDFIPETLSKAQGSPG